jgi:hypothetical protein
MWRNWGVSTQWKWQVWWRTKQSALSHTSPQNEEGMSRFSTWPWTELTLQRGPCVCVCVCVCCGVGSAMETSGRSPCICNNLYIHTHTCTHILLLLLGTRKWVRQHHGLYIFMTAKGVVLSPTAGQEAELSCVLPRVVLDWRQVRSYPPGLHSQLLSIGKGTQFSSILSPKKKVLSQNMTLGHDSQTLGFK